MKARISPTTLPGLLVIDSDKTSDARGYFEETWNQHWMQSHGIDTHFVQDNHSYSRSKGTIRGFHLQNPPTAQAKLVRCSKGAIFDVSVDIRRGSPTFGNWLALELSPENGKQLFIPTGFLHAFMTMTDHTEVQYKCSSYYEPQAEVSVLWNSIDVQWPVMDQHYLSERDAEAQSFERFSSQFEYGDLE
jgi:dTDP-4-dehydrorhamnose 3,5-epimerase